MSTPQQFAALGLDIVTNWAQTTDRLIKFAEAFEARGGANQFNNAKHVAPQGGELEPHQVAENAELDRMAGLALEVVTHQNELNAWLTASRKVRLAILRTDY